MVGDENVHDSYGDHGDVGDDDDDDDVNDDDDDETKVALLVVLSIAGHSWALVSQQYFIKKSEDDKITTKLHNVLKNFMRHA